VWLLTGIWHGANWTFLLWGMMYFVLLMFEKGLKKVDLSRIPLQGFFKWIITMFFVIIGWVVFRANTIGDALVYIKTMLFTNGAIIFDPLFVDAIKTVFPILLIAIIFSVPTVPYVKKKLNYEETTPILKFAAQGILVLLFIASIMSIVSSENNPFIYFNF
jgi:hypothetical protein